MSHRVVEYRETKKSLPQTMVSWHFRTICSHLHDFPAWKWVFFKAHGASIGVQHFCKIHLLGLKKSRAQRGVFLCQENAWRGQVPIGTGPGSIYIFLWGVWARHGIWPVLIYVKLDYIWGLTDHTRCGANGFFAR